MLEIGYNQGNAVINLEHKNLKLITKQPIKKTWLETIG